MSSPTRWPNGINNANPQGALGNYGCPDPAFCHTFFDDFDRYLASNWTVTLIGTGTQALTAGDGGLLLLTNTAADDDQITMQNTVATFLMEAGKPAFFQARFKVSDATQSDLQIGLVVTDTTPLDATDGIYFMKDDGDAQLDVYVRKDATTGSTSATNVATVVSDTYMTVGWAYNGKDEVAFFVNNVKVSSLSGASTYLPDAALAVSVSVKNGEAVAKTMTVDYLFAAKDR
jgi:hypothetical protein